jgi:hypothetical protein
MAVKYVSNTIQTMSWSGSWSYSILFLSLFICSFIFSDTALAQSQDQLYRQQILRSQLSYSRPLNSSPVSFSADTQEVEAVPPEFPNPKSVMFKSMLVPGWGQIVNKQIWKVPIVYGLIGGVAGYTVYLTKRYHDYRAAYYNAQRGSETDYRFGQTPAYIPADINSSALRDTRDQLRNRRDLMYLMVGVAYGLNVLDAYVFAHMRSFDVSEDLSMNIVPGAAAGRPAGLTLKLKLNNRAP